MIGDHVIPALLLIVANVSIVSGITVDQVQVQMAKNSNRREFIKRMDAAAVVEDEISTRPQTKRYNQEIMSKTSNLRDGAIVPPSRRREEDAAYYDEEAYYYNWNGLGFNIAEYSLKYHKCTTMNLFNAEDEENNQNDNDNGPFTPYTFVTFRLCPTDTCSADGWNGCRDTYGEYMMEMGTFLESQIKYDEEIFEQYCNYCETCMYFENYFYGNNRNLASHACKYYDDCSTYEEVCANEDDSVSLTYDDLYQCIPIEDAVTDDDGDDGDDGNNGDDDGTQYFLGLACDDTLQMAVYSDEDCTQFVGLGDAVYDITGYNVEVGDDVMGSFLTHDCISCRESDKPYKITYQDQNDENDILEVCEDVYLASARCDERLWNPVYDSLVAEYNADLACDFLQNVIKGNMNEYGQNINEAQTPDFFHKWIPNKFWPDDDVIVSQDEVAYLTMGFLGCMVMLVYVSYFKKQIAKQSAPLLDVNTYPCDSREYPASGDTTGTFTSYGSSPTTSPTSTKGSVEPDRNFDPVAAARSID